MFSPLSYLKKNNQNLYSLVVSLLLALWYNGISGLINHYMPNRGPMLSITLLIIPLAMFLSDDGHLDELYKPAEIQYPVISSAQASLRQPQNSTVQARRAERFSK
ncbi:hypothetical protein QKU48_gp1147 [Fadolivirus algeromassiliense]|jgi:hypothetical protein|uniref:Uncharacterized protein n=1 Tax=Fadolivirus FV1/VV64 TaxID=3070911 RepID=A0A7D3QV00_9VIRU|nr:hypothetical protein QKU48_gp1147 [Fadolivirus algeromassiliense]QKF94605.1 hypothetical protein Fadolivirus_1_1147 [Fadolivirus FV1/VV64]